jgi:hypothetical protein
MVALSRKNYYYGIATVRVLCIVFYLHVYINNVNPLNDNNSFPLHCYQGTKYFKSINMFESYRQNRSVAVF